MAVRKKCKSSGCRSSPKCGHPWWFDVMHNGKRYRMPVNDFALPRGAALPVTTKQEALSRWEPEFKAMIGRGEDPTVPPAPPAESATMTVAKFLTDYESKYVDVEPLKSRSSIKSRLKTLKEHLGSLPLKDLEKPGPIDDVKQNYKGRKQATLNRLLGQLRHAINWAIGRELLEKTPFHRHGIRIKTKGEERRERRVSHEEETVLLDAAAKMTTAEHKCVGQQMRDRIIGALETACRKGEMLKIQNRDVDWTQRVILLRAENTKDSESRRIPFDPNGRLAAVLKRRKFLGPDAYVFGTDDGHPVKEFRTAWESLLVLAQGQTTRRERRGARVNRQALKAIDLHWHDLRHEAASRWLERGVNLRVIQLALGHTSITTTQRYLNVTDLEMAKAMEQLWAAPEGAKAKSAGREPKIAAAAG